MLTKIIKDTQTRYYQNLIHQHSNSSIGLWKVFGNILSKNKNKNSKINQLKSNNKTIKDPKEISNTFNNFFCNIGPDLAKSFNNFTDSQHKEYLGEQSNQSMYMRKTNTQEVLDLISKLESKKSSGHDGLSSKFIKLCSPFLSVILANIFNQSITNGVYPDSLKIARVSPIHKKGDVTDPNNYRPISVLNLLNKIFEKIIHKRLYKYLTKFNLIYKYQFGFREGYSTMHALVELTDRIKDAIDKKLLTCGIFVDLSKAFDTVNHNILLDKLSHYGIRGNLHNLFSSYLSNRKQFVRVNNVNSDLKDITCGVPQGSVLGPLLFLLYINDLANCCPEVFFRIFADDTGIFFHCKDITTLSSLAEKIIQNISRWFECNKLTLNASKTSYVIFRSSRYQNKNLPNTLQCNNIIINRECQAKYLGVTLDEYLNYNEYVEDLCKKLKRLFPVFYNIRNYLDKDHIKTIYFTMLYSRLKYGCITYGLTSLENMNKIQVIQNKLLKVLLKKPFRYSTSKLHNDLELLKFEDIVNQEITGFVFDFLKGNLPCVFEGYYEHRLTEEDFLEEVTRFRLKIPPYRTNIGENTVKVQGVKLFNKYVN